MKKTTVWLGLALWMVVASGMEPKAWGASPESVHSLAVEVLDQAGFAVTSESGDLLEIIADGRRLETAGVSTETPWNVAVFLDQRLSESRLVHNAASDLAEVADDLVSLGSVEVVLGAEEVTRAVLPTRDAEALRQAFAWLRVREGGDGAQLEVRRRFVGELDVEDLEEKPYTAVSATAAQTVSELRFGVRRALEEEVRIVEQQRRQVLAWALENRRDQPALLLIVSSGDDDSLAYYDSLLQRIGMSEALEGLTVEPPEPSREAFGRALSSLGWVTVTFSPGGSGTLVREAGSRRDDERVETVVQDGQLVDRTILTPRFDPRDLLRRKEREEAELSKPRLLSPHETAAAVADATGGDVAVDRQGLKQVLSRLGRRIHLRVVDDSGLYSERSVEVRYASGHGDDWQPPRTRRWISAGTPELLSELRVRRLLEDGVEEGPLLVTAQTRGRALGSPLAVEIEPLDDSAREIGSGPLRLTVGTLDQNDRASYHHSTIAIGEAIEQRDGGTLALESELLLAAAVGRPVAVLVEDLKSGYWGGAYATLVSTAGGDLQASLLSTPRVIHLLEPESSMVFGPTLFETIHDQDVRSVRFFVDGDLEDERTAPPFDFRIDLGRLPEPHRIEVVAYDAAGLELGRDRLSVNESGGLFRAHIVRPRYQERGSDERPLVGPVEVEAQIEAPRAVQVARVEFFWNEDLIATRFAPPYVQRVPIPAEQPQGFLRIVAHLEDGSAAEDVLFVNSRGGSERVKVELIQLYAVVTDREGHPVQGLDIDRFRVLEEGAEQEIATFDEAKDQPLTVGLAIDTSASMFIKLPRVQKAASGFLDGLDNEKDRAFLVDFGTDPRLHHDTSRDLGAVEESLFDLEPGGQTAIWKGISFSLVQLQGVQGKKALIVFSDGADEDPDFSYRTCLKFARRVGVPIYVIVSNDEIYRTGGRGLNVRGFINRLESLARAVGGRVYFSRVGEDLEEIYAQIDEELRSQYLLGYYARDEGEGRWRSVRIDVDAPGARARTIAGYFR